VTFLASHLLQNSPQFIVQGVEVWTSWEPILSADNGQNLPPLPLLSHLGFAGRSWVLLKDSFRTIEDIHVNTLGTGHLNCLNARSRGLNKVIQLLYCVSLKIYNKFANYFCELKFSGNTHQRP
jgi:hypothetical protein